MPRLPPGPAPVRYGYQWDDSMKSMLGQTYQAPPARCVENYLARDLVDRPRAHRTRRRGKSHETEMPSFSSESCAGLRVGKSNHNVAKWRFQALQTSGLHARSHWGHYAAFPDICR